MWCLRFLICWIKNDSALVPYLISLAVLLKLSVSTVCVYTSFDFPPHTHAAMSLILAHSSSMVIFTACAIEKIEPGPPQDRNTISCSLKTFLHPQGFGCPRPVAQDQAVHAGQGFQQLSPLLPCGGGGRQDPGRPSSRLACYWYWLHQASLLVGRF